MSFTNGRRSFMSALASLAGAAALPASGRDVVAQTPAAPTSDWDLRWLDTLRGKHKQLYDLGSFDLGADQRPLRYTRNFLDTFRDVYQLESPNINTLVGVSGPAFPINASDRLWEKYQLGERSKIVDRAACMECGACALNCPEGAISVRSGVGCAAGILNGALRGTEPTCGCGEDTGNCC